MGISANTQKFQTYMRIKGGIPLSPLDMPIAASQVLHKGDFVVRTAGKITKAIAPSGSINTVVLIGAATVMVGVVAQGLTVDANSVSTDGRAVTTVPVIPIWGTEHMIGGVGGVGAISSTTFASYVVDTSYALANFTGAAITTWGWGISSTVTNANLRLIALSEESSTTETYPYLWVEVLRSAQMGA